MDDEHTSTPAADSSPGRVDDPALRTAFGFDRSDDQWLELLRESKSTLALGRLGPYRLLGELGRGGQGSVYKAHRDGDLEPVALKRMPVLGASVDAAARFEREREAISLLSHPGIVGIRRVEVIDGQSVLAMELVEGVPIDQWASSLPDRPVDRILDTFLKVCDAVAHAHRRGVLHRDLKPSNILVDVAGEPRVLDFGLAKLTEPAEPRTGGAPGNGRSAVDSFITRASGFVGTPAYAAPEQLAGDQKSIDTRTDVYALGVLLATLLTGSLPLDAKVPLPALFDQIRSGISRPPSSSRPGLGRELDAIALKAVAVEPGRRYASVDDFAADLRRFLSGQTVLAHPPTALYKLRKIWQRHRLIAPILALAGLGVLTLSIVSTALALNLREQRDRLSEASSSEFRARQDAEKALAESRKQADRHKAAAQFLSDMLAGVHESYLAGQSLGSREIIDHAARRLDAGELANQPEVEVSLLYSVGRAYYDLGHTREAEPYIMRALEKSRAHYGADHVETGRCLYMVGLLAEQKARYAEAARLYGEARAIITARAGEKDALGAQIDNNLACVLRSLGKFNESEQLHRKALAIRLELRGEKHRDIAESYRNLGLTLAKLKRFDEAHDAIDKTIALHDELYGPDHERSLYARIYRSRVLSEQNRFAEALVIREACLQAIIASHGEDYMMTGRLHRYVALALAGLGRYDEAIVHVRAQRDMMRRSNEEDRRAIAEASCDIAEYLGRLGRRAEQLVELDAARTEAIAAGEDGMAMLPRIEKMRLEAMSVQPPPKGVTPDEPAPPIRPPGAPEPEPTAPPAVAARRSTL